MKSKLIILLLIQCISYYFVSGQNSITSCDDFFTDSGGQAGDYSNGESSTTLICPDGSGASHINLFLFPYDIANGDILCFYDGMDASADLLFCSNDIMVSSEVNIRATAINTTGCIFAEFTSDGSGVGRGWIAEISCVQSCQHVFAEITGTNPVIDPVDTGYIDVCPGSLVRFEGKGVYPQSGVIYDQSDATSTFTWTFGDGQRAYGPIVQHIYDEPGGYFVNLEIEDEKGCKSTTIQKQRVRVSAKPDFVVSVDNLPQNICVGDTIDLTASLSIGSGSNLEIETKELSFPVGKTLSDTLFLPDGSGASYSTSLLFTDFGSGAVVTSNTDLESICLSLEHSYSGDLEITLECPNGQSVDLLQYGTLGTANFGEPMASSSVDGISADTTPGRPYYYCFTENFPDFGRLRDVNPPTYTYTTVPDQNGMRHTYSDPYFAPGSYEPDDDFSGLIGCPLNGEWTIQVTDNLAADNGWIFEWGINFREDLFRNVEKFNPAIVNYDWTPQADIIDYNFTEIQASPVDAGFARYSIDVVDEFGCEFDTSVVIPTLPFVHPDCYECRERLSLDFDTTLCPGNTVALESREFPMELVKFNTYPNESFGALSHPASNPLVNTNLIQEIFPQQLTDVNGQLVEICVEIVTNISSDITAHIESPSGETMLLFNGVGGFDPNFTQTCFRTDASTPIQTGSAPFTGTYSPMGSWNDLNNSTINGEWKLILSDAFGLQDIGSLVGWSISFNHDYNWDYEWAHNDLSCTDCPDPVYTHSADGVVYLETVNDLGCSLRDSVIVGTKPDFDAVDLGCVFDLDGNITITWDEPTGTDSYEISYTDEDGTFFDWDATNDRSRLFQNLQLGDSIIFQARAIPTDQEAYCASLIDSIVCRVGECMLENTFQTTDPICSVGGRIEISSTDPIGDVEYRLSNGEINETGIFTDLDDGQYSVIVIDDFGCSDTIDFAMSIQANPLMITFDSITPSCGGMDGEIVLHISGGTSPYTITWPDGLITQDTIRTGLEAGSYNIHIEDALTSCDTTITIDLYQDHNLFLDSIMLVQNVSCPGVRDGAARAFVRGGTGTMINFLWNDPLATTSFDVRLLPGGVYTVTVTDEAGCEKIDSIEIMEPDTFSIDSIVVHNNCFGAFEGSISVDITGGTMPYVFNWTGPNAFNSNMEDIDNLEAGDYFLNLIDNNNCIQNYSFTIEQPMSALTTTLTQTDTSCAGQNNSTLMVTAAGGTMPYSYNWQGGPNTPEWMGVADGWQYVEVTDGNLCTVLDSILVVSFDSILADLSIVPPTCVGNDNGIIGVSQVSGGSGNGNLSDYTYLWDYMGIDSFAIVNALGDRDYTVTIRDSRGCMADFTRFLPDGDSLMIELSTVDLDCANDSTGSVVVTNVVNSNPPLSYMWNTGDTLSGLMNLGPGLYGVTVTDDTGCEAEASYEIVAVDSIVIATNLTLPKCNEEFGSVELLIFGGTDPFDIMWADGDSTIMRDSLVRGRYDVTVTDDNGCMEEKIVFIFTESALDSLDLAVDSIDCFNTPSGSITINPLGGTPPYQYSIDGGSSFVPFMFFPDLSSGDYDIVVLDADGCEVRDSVTLINPPQIDVVNISDTSMIFGDTLVLIPQVVGNQGNYDIFWESDSVGFRVLNDSTALFYPIQNSLYNFVVIDDNGCEVEISFSLLVDKLPQILVPTGFTPDANNNNRLGVLGEEDVFIEEFKIFDRWGELMYEQNDFFIDNGLQGWDGDFNGEKCQPGVYVWYAIFIYTDGLTYKTFGHTTLIR